MNGTTINQLFDIHPSGSQGLLSRFDAAYDKNEMDNELKIVLDEIRNNATNDEAHLKLKVFFDEVAKNTKDNNLKTKIQDAKQTADETTRKKKYADLLRDNAIFEALSKNIKSAILENKEPSPIADAVQSFHDKLMRYNSTLVGQGLHGGPASEAALILADIFILFAFKLPLATVGIRMDSEAKPQTRKNEDVTPKINKDGLTYQMPWR